MQDTKKKGENALAIRKNIISQKASKDYLFIHGINFSAHGFNRKSEDCLL